MYSILQQKPSDERSPVGPYLLAFFIFVVCGSGEFHGESLEVVWVKISFQNFDLATTFIHFLEQKHVVVVHHSTVYTVTLSLILVLSSEMPFVIRKLNAVCGQEMRLHDSTFSQDSMDHSSSPPPHTHTPCILFPPPTHILHTHSHTHTAIFQLIQSIRLS